MPEFRPLLKENCEIHGGSEYESTETRNGEPAPEQTPQSSILLAISDDPSQILS
jgi:hypothetical protein